MISSACRTGGVEVAALAQMFPAQSSRHRALCSQSIAFVHATGSLLFFASNTPRVLHASCAPARLAQPFTRPVWLTLPAAVALSPASTRKDCIY